MTSLAPHGMVDALLRALGVIFLILNLKNLPITWHIRVLRAIFYHINLSSTAMRKRDLFRPLVTTTWNSPLDCDYNLHKSNSTYFKDLDVARAHYIGALVRTGLRRLRVGDTEGLPAWRNPEDAHSSACVIRGKMPTNYIVALGGVSCMFRKEIKPLARFEIWTRLLAWDEKWVYTLSHIVKAGAIRPRGYSLQPGRDSDRDGLLAHMLHRIGLRNRSKPHPSRRSTAHSNPPSVEKGRKSGSDDATSPPTDHQQGDWNDEMRRAVYASSVARYVCKKGRAVIPPEIVLERSRLLPESPRPSHVPDLRFGHTFKPPDEDTSPAAVPPTTKTASHGARGNRDGEAQGGVSGSAGVADSGHGSAELTWDEVHQMRTAGLKYATQFDGLAGLHDAFGKDGDDVLGVYGDFLY